MDLQSPVDAVWHQYVILLLPTQTNAKFGYTEVKIGFIPAIVSIFLIRKIGVGKTKKLLFNW